LGTMRMHRLACHRLLPDGARAGLDLFGEACVRDIGRHLDSFDQALNAPMAWRSGA
jgi:hypothetical protein